jgi:hypothetical protein
MFECACVRAYLSVAYLPGWRPPAKPHAATPAPSLPPLPFIPQGAFGFFLLVLLLCSAIGLYLCQLVTLAAPSVPLAVSLLPALLFVVMGFSGFVVRLPKLPSWLAWGGVGSFGRWAFQVRGRLEACCVCVCVCVCVLGGLPWWVGEFLRVVVVVDEQALVVNEFEGNTGVVFQGRPNSQPIYDWFIGWVRWRVAASCPHWALKMPALCSAGGAPWYRCTRARVCVCVCVCAASSAFRVTTSGSRCPSSATPPSPWRSPATCPSGAACFPYPRVLIHYARLIDLRTHRTCLTNG